MSNLSPRTYATVTEKQQAQGSSVEAVAPVALSRHGDNDFKSGATPKKARVLPTFAYSIRNAWLSCRPPPHRTVLRSAKNPLLQLINSKLCQMFLCDPDSSLETTVEDVKPQRDRCLDADVAWGYPRPQDNFWEKCGEGHRA